MQPLVTIVTPYYNRADFLKETLQSLQAQTLVDWEAILWNDGSTDNSLDIVEEMARKDSRFKSFRRRKTRAGIGLGSGLCKGTGPLPRSAR